MSTISLTREVANCKPFSAGPNYRRRALGRAISRLRDQLNQTAGAATRDRLIDRIHKLSEQRDGLAGEAA